MTFRKLLAILFIFCCSAVAWFGLATSVVVRTGASDRELDEEVTRLWGGRHVQRAPEAWIEQVRQQRETVQEPDADGRPVVRYIERPVVERHYLELASSRIDVSLALEHRRKGLLWYDLFEVDFAGQYHLLAPPAVEGPLSVAFRFPATESIYDSFTFSVAGREGAHGDLEGGVMVTLDEIRPGEEIPIEVSYRSRGLDSWTYAFRDDGVARVRDFELALAADSSGIDFLPGTLSPTTARAVQDGWNLLWRFDNLVTGKRIGVDLPNRLNPGPLTARITFFAPVSLLFFITVLVILGIVHGSNLHPMHYFFVAAAFFAFHLLLAYLVDHIDVHYAFAISAASSLFLVISYLRVVGGNYFALAQAGTAQLVYLVLFNYAFFFRGFTGLTVTVGAVITLFVLMQLTAPVDWDRAFNEPGRPAAASSET